MRASIALFVGITFAIALTPTVRAQSSFLGSDAAFGARQGRIFLSALGASGSHVSNPATVSVTGNCVGPNEILRKASAYFAQAELDRRDTR